MINAKKVKWIIMSIMAVIMIITAFFTLWWYGLLLPGWIEWNEKCTSYGDMKLKLKDRTLLLIDDDNISDNDYSNVVWTTDKNWMIQDMLVYDINKDGVEEIVALVWKHGSFGEHKPVWISKNDIRLEQHIFIYQWDEKREGRIRPLWMSSSLGYKVDGIARGNKDKLIVQKHNGESSLWQWVDFGLKYVGENKSTSSSLICAGDNLIHPWILKYDDKYDYFYENIKEYIQAADIAVINQETMFVEDEGMISDYPQMATTSKVGDAMIEAGFDVICLANNHTLDKGIIGVTDTVKYWKNKKNENVFPAYIGVNLATDSSKNNDSNVDTKEKYQNIFLCENNGIHIAMLNYTYGTNGIASPKDNPYIVERMGDEARIRRQLRYARARADVVIVFTHWGTEYSDEPDENQLKMKDIFLEENVDVVVGSHSHVLQPMETYEKNGHKMLVYYSLGNFISGQNRCERLVGGLAEFVINKTANGKISIDENKIEKIVTHQNNKTVTVYPMDEYGKELQKEHIVKEMTEYIEKIKKPQK